MPVRPDKKAVAEVLEEIATLLALQGENVFKVRAYENAARALTRTREPLDELIRTGRLQTIRGIGSSTAKVIQEYYETGEPPTLLRELRAKTPPGLLELLAIPGLGPQRVRLLYEKLDVRTVADLEYALQENRLQLIEGFGPRTIETIRQGLELYRAASGRFLLGRVYPIARAMEAFLRQRWPGPVRLVGSVRRWCPVVGNVNLILQGSPPEDPTCLNLNQAPLPLDVLELQDSTWWLRAPSVGLPVVLTWVPAEDWPWAVRYYTGSREHNQAFREWAVRQGYTASGFRLQKDGTPLPLPPTGTADDAYGDEPVFAALGLAWLPPEVREGRDEIERAVRGDVPRLIEPDDVRGVLHVHTDYSDGADSLQEMMETARELGLEYVGISDHSPAAYYANGLDRERLLQQWAEMEEVQRRVPEVRILRGMEVDILPDGRLDLDEDLLQRLDFVVASVHSRFQMSRAEMTERIVRAMRHPCTTILGHPTGRLLLGRKGYEVDLDRILEVAAETGTLIEINANPYRLDLDWTHLEKARRMGIRFSIDPDTHRKSDLGDYVYGVGIARKGWLTAADVVNTLPVSELLDVLGQKRRRRP